MGVVQGPVAPSTVLRDCVVRTCDADRAAEWRVIRARLRRFRLGADKSPAPSTQALQPNPSDAPLCGRLRRDPIRDALALGAGVPGLIMGWTLERTAPMLPAFSRANGDFVQHLHVFSKQARTVRPITTSAANY